MKYYLVNFLVCYNNTIAKDNTIALSISMDTYDCTNAFKKQIDSQMKCSKDAQAIVIKTYRQISEDIFQLVHPFMKENKVRQEDALAGSLLSYKFQSSSYSS